MRAHIADRTHSPIHPSAPIKWMVDRVILHFRANAEKTIPYDELIARSKIPVFGAFGEKDALIAREDVLRFRQSLEAANRSYEIAIYPDAPHSWLNHRIEAWREPQAEAAWSALRAFLERVHGGGYPADRVRWSFSG